MNKKQTIFGAAGVVALIIIMWLVSYWQKRKKAKVLFDLIEKKIDENIGTSGVDVGSVIFNTEATPYLNVDQDAREMYEADGLWDDDEKPINILRGKTKGQIAALNERITQLYGITLDKALKNVYDKCYGGVGFDCGKYEQAIAIIKSSK